MDHGGKYIIDIEFFSKTSRNFDIKVQKHYLLNFPSFFRKRHT